MDASSSATTTVVVAAVVAVLVIAVAVVVDKEIFKNHDSKFYFIFHDNNIKSNWIGLN